MAEAKTLFQKLWDSHRVVDLDDGEALIYIDRHLVNEVTSPQAFESLARRGRKPGASMRCSRPRTTTYPP